MPRTPCLRVAAPFEAVNVALLLLVSISGSVACAIWRHRQCFFDDGNGDVTGAPNDDAVLAVCRVVVYDVAGPRFPSLSHSAQRYSDVARYAVGHAGVPQSVAASVQVVRRHISSRRTPCAHSTSGLCTAHDAARWERVLAVRHRHRLSHPLPPPVHAALLGGAFAGVSQPRVGVARWCPSRSCWAWAHRCKAGRCRS